MPTFTPTAVDTRNIRIAGQSQVWSINGQLHLVWLVPVDLNNDGQFTETMPIAFLATSQDLLNAGINPTATRNLSSLQWSQVGGLIMGNVRDLNNPADDPFEFFVDQMVENSVLFPWLLDPEIMAKTASAWLQGRPLSEAELASTQWWKNHSPSERQWLVFSSSDPAGAIQLSSDNRIMVLDLIERAGINNAPSGLVHLLADSFTRGEWSQVMLQNQIQVLADPTKRGQLDQRVVDFLNAQEGGFTLDTTQAREDRVRDMVNTWLGPAFGGWGDDDIKRWAGRFRNDPDAEERLSRLLSGQRMSLFPAYTDPTLTYQDIAGPWRTLAGQIWGEAIDETDPFFAQVIAQNDAAKATQMLRTKGLELGKQTTVQTALSDMLAGFGGGIVRMG